jgi:hypothetical protein
MNAKLLVSVEEILNSACPVLGFSKGFVGSEHVAAHIAGAAVRNVGGKNITSPATFAEALALTREHYIFTDAWETFESAIELLVETSGISPTLAQEITISWFDSDESVSIQEYVEAHNLG